MRSCALAGVDDVDAWTPLQAEPVQARQLPDGVLEVRSPGQAQPDIFIVEIASYPDARVPSQAAATPRWSSSNATSSPR